MTLNPQAYFLASFLNTKLPNIESPKKWRGKVNEIMYIYVSTQSEIDHFINSVYPKVTLALLQKVTDKPTWGDFKHLIIENKVSHIKSNVGA